MASGKRPLAAMSARAHPRSVAWRVDVDYVRKLGAEDRAWLADFLDRYYAADFRGVDDEGWTDADRKERYRAKNCANRDMMTCALPSDGVPFDERLAEPDEEVGQVDDYLDSPAYKTARENYRKEPTPANRVRLARTVKR